MGEQEPNWKAAKAMLCDMGFLSKLLSFDVGSLKPTTIEKLEPFIKNPQFNPESVRNVSTAASGLCQWVHDVHTEYCQNYLDAASTASPCSQQSLEFSENSELSGFSLVL